MHRYFNLLKQEVMAVIPSVIFFCIVFNLITFTTDLILRADKQTYITYLSATIAGLVAGKVLIIANSLPFINLFPHKPLIYNISWKFFIYMLIIFILRLGEKFLRASITQKSLVMGGLAVKFELMNSIFWSTEMWLALSFLLYIVCVEFMNALGVEKVKRMLFG